MKSLLTLATLLLDFSATPGFAQETTTSKAKFLIEGGIEFGGDEILKVFFTNGEDQTMRAGQGGTIAVGGQFEFKGVKQLMLRTSVGFKYNTTAADNANIRFTRFPITLMPFYKINDAFRLGAGITTHQGIKLKGDGFVNDVEFDGAIGPRFEFGYKWLALTYTVINYTAQGEKVSANAVGAFISFAFPK